MTKNPFGSAFSARPNGWAQQGLLGLTGRGGADRNGHEPCVLGHKTAKVKKRPGRQHNAAGRGA